MNNEFEIIEELIGPVVEIEERVRLWRMPATFGRDYQRISDYLSSHAVECSGMPYARYPDMDWELELNRGRLSRLFAALVKQWHFFAGMPTSKSLANHGELMSRVLAKRRYARAVHRGPYRQCTATYKALYDWVKSQGLAATNEAIEFYVNDPAEVDEADIETVILIPLQ